MDQQALAAFIAATVGAYHRCENVPEWRGKHRARLDYIAHHLLPSGSGIDNGSKIDIDRSTEDSLWFTTAFHHMDEQGSYNGWTEHTVHVTPAFNGMHITVGGPDRNGIKDALAEEFFHCLSTVDNYDESRGEHRAPWYWKTQVQAK